MLIKNGLVNKVNDEKVMDSDQMREVFKREYKIQNGNRKILYIHTPYCNGKCRFCICPSISCKTLQEPIDFVKEVFPTQVRQYHDILEEVSFDEVYFGGGTPTLLSDTIWEEVFNQIPNFNQIPIKSFESSPDTLAFEHLELLKKYNFSYLSFGVQSLNKEICRWQNRRYIRPEELKYISSVLRDNNMYFNVDLICYLGAGDLTDLPDFQKDLEFIMKECKSSSITIHQHLQSRFTCEKTQYLMKLIKEMLQKYPEYECINSELQDEDVYEDTVYRAEYRLICGKREFRNYMFKKYPSVPMEGCDVLALGYIPNKVSVKSNADNLLYLPARNQLERIEFDHELLVKEQKIRRNKGLSE